MNALASYSPSLINPWSKVGPASLVVSAIAALAGTPVTVVHSGIYTSRTTGDEKSGHTTPWALSHKPIEVSNDAFPVRIQTAKVSRAWEGVAAVVWRDEVVERIERLGAKEDGWRGADSAAASSDAISQAIHLVERLALEVPAARPKVGLEEDGVFTFFWTSGEGLASISISGDETYAFYYKRDEQSVLVPEADLASPLDPRLLEALALIC